MNRAKGKVQKHMISYLSSLLAPQGALHAIVCQDRSSKPIFLDFYSVAPNHNDIMNATLRTHNQKQELLRTLIVRRAGLSLEIHAVHVTHATNKHMRE